MKQFSLGNLVTIKTGKLDANAMEENGRYPFFTCSKQVFRINSYAFDGKAILLAGNNASGNFDVKYYEGKFNAYQRTYVITINDEKKLNYTFLKHKLEAHLKIFKSLSVGANTRFLKLGMIKDLKIPLPPLKEQKRIAAILDSADLYRQKTKALIAKYDELTQSLFLEMFGDPVTNLKGWEVLKFSEVGKLDRGKSKHRPRNAPELLGGSHPLIQTGDIANCGVYLLDYKNTYSDIGLAQSRKWKKGTLCITIAANIAKTGILTFDACFPDSIVGFVPNDKTNNIYVLCWLSFLQKILEESAPESAQKNINLAILRDLEFPCPLIDLQNQFAEHVHAIEKQKAQAQESLAKAEDLFNSLLQRAFKGELSKEIV